MLLKDFFQMFPDEAKCKNMTCHTSEEDSCPIQIKYKVARL